MSQETSASTSTEDHARGRDDAFPPLDGAIEKYRRALGQDRDAAQARYGFTLFHSLKPEEKVHHLEEAGFQPQDWEDHYNLGCVAAGSENWPQAISHFEKALKELPSHFETAFNLALAKERAGKDAKADWKRAKELAPSDDERAKIDAHSASRG